MKEVKSIYDIGFEHGYAKAKSEPKIHEITINKTELLEAIKDEDSLDKYIDKLIDEILNKVN